MKMMKRSFKKEDWNSGCLIGDSQQQRPQPKDSSFLPHSPFSLPISIFSSLSQFSPPCLNFLSPVLIFSPLSQFSLPCLHFLSPVSIFCLLY